MGLEKSRHADKREIKEQAQEKPLFAFIESDEQERIFIRGNENDLVDFFTRLSLIYHSSESFEENYDGYREMFVHTIDQWLKEKKGKEPLQLTTLPFRMYIELKLSSRSEIPAELRQNLKKHNKELFVTLVNHPSRTPDEETMKEPWELLKENFSSVYEKIQQQRSEK